VPPPPGNSDPTQPPMQHVHEDRSNMVLPSMLTSIPANILNQIKRQLGIPNRFNQSEIDSRRVF
jgi:hypothetical protein